MFRNSRYCEALDKANGEGVHGVHEGLKNFGQAYSEDATKNHNVLQSLESPHHLPLHCDEASCVYCNAKKCSMKPTSRLSLHKSVSSRSD